VEDFIAYFSSKFFSPPLQVKYNQKRVDNFSRIRYQRAVFRAWKAYFMIQYKVKRKYQAKLTQFVRGMFFAWAEVSHTQHRLRLSTYQVCFSPCAQFPVLLWSVGGSVGDNVCAVELRKPNAAVSTLLMEFNPIIATFSLCVAQNWKDYPRVMMIKPFEGKIPFLQSCVPRVGKFPFAPSLG
jgi:hypothetical protein